MKRIRRELDARYTGRVLLAERISGRRTSALFRDGEECQMAFHFPLMRGSSWGLRQEERTRSSKS